MDYYVILRECWYDDYRLDDAETRTSGDATRQSDDPRNARGAVLVPSRPQ